MTTSKDTIKKTKGQIHKMEGITDKSYIADKGLVSKTYKYSYSSKIWWYTPLEWLYFKKVNN